MNSFLDIWIDLFTGNHLKSIILSGVSRAAISSERIEAENNSWLEISSSSWVSQYKHEKSIISNFKFWLSLSLDVCVC